LSISLRDGTWCSIHDSQLGTVMKAMRLLAWGLVMLVGAGLARADGRPEPVVYTPKPPICCELAYLGYDWSGFYAGGHAGVAFTQTELTIPGLGFVAIETGADLIEHTATGFAGGLHIGWQKQWANIVAGVEVSYTALDGDVSSRITLSGTPISVSTEVSNLLLVVGRLGYAQDNMLAYFKAGYASADVDFTLRAATTPPFADSLSEREHGWIAGVGFEYAIRENLILGIEYNYVGLNVDDRALAAETDAGVDLQSILARVTFKFGARPEVVPAK
jgi:outer membrane immunogenic protein